MDACKQVRSDDGPRRLSTVPGGGPPSSVSGAGGQGSSAKRPPRNRFVWLGPTRRRVVGLGPGEATTIPLKVGEARGALVTKVGTPPPHTFAHSFFGLFMA